MKEMYQNGTTKISYNQIQTLCDELDASKISPAELFKFIQTDSFYNLLSHPWEEPKKLTKLLRVIVTAAATVNDLQHQPSVLELIDKVLKCNLLRKIISSTLVAFTQDHNLRNRTHAKLLHFLIEILLMGYQFHLTKMEYYETEVFTLVSTLKPIQLGFLLDMTLPLLAKLEAEYMSSQNARIEKTRRKLESQFRNRKFIGSHKQPPENFRELSLIPTPEELDRDFVPFLRTAKIFESYESNEHYLDVQFRLLREDLINPLRKGIENHKAGETKLFCYKNVKIEERILHLISGEYVNYVQIENKQKLFCRKTIKHCSLLCLSSDGYKKEFLFATVVDRDERIYEGKIGIKFEYDFNIDFHADYEMVESPAYFEAYRHVLMALQNIQRNEPLPFSKYLVHGQIKTQFPLYYNNETSYDFSCIMTEEAQEFFPTTFFTVSALKQIPLEYLILNESQFAAFCYTLESEIALIQGPPGTGKSYIGLQLAKFLLHENNWPLWNFEERPLLIVCYTNHALDQFLEGIYHFMEIPSIARVGARCQNPILQQFTMVSQRRQFSNHEHDMLRYRLKGLRGEIKAKRTYLKQLKNRLACHKALWFNENPFDDESFIYWLTTFQIYDPKNREMNAKVIRELVKKGISEEMAREAFASICSKRVCKVSDEEEEGQIEEEKEPEVDIEELYKKIKAAHFFVGEYPEYTKPWPMLKDIDRVMRLGYSEKVAIKLLQTENKNVELIEKEFQKFPFISKKKQNNVGDGELVDGEDEDLSLYGIANNGVEEVDDDSLDNCKNTEWQLPAEVKHFGEFLQNAQPMKEEEKNEITDIWAIPLQTRWRLYQLWILEARKLTENSLEELEDFYYNSKCQLTEINYALDKIILNSVKVIGMTTTAAAKYQSHLRDLKPWIVIAEEAAEVLEAHIFTSLSTSCQHLILIGDHQQLRPNFAEYKLKDYHLDVSLFERLVKNGCSHSVLNTQHRMRPEFSSLMRQHFYPGLIDADLVLSRPNVKGVTKDMMFIQHSNPEYFNEEDLSRMNVYEVHYALSLAKYFLNQGYRSDQITILCTYSEQRFHIRKESKKMISEDCEIRVENVDNFQGEESDIIILSLVRSLSSNNMIGYLNIANRVCVALSRAKIGMYVIGNINYLASASQNDLWGNIKKSIEDELVQSLSEVFVTKCQKHGTTQTIENWIDFDTKCPEGGCQIICDDEMECGHRCLKLCHGYDVDHEKYKCEQPCLRICSHEGVKKCKKLCFEECDACVSEITKLRSCGHEVLAKCYQNPEDVICRALGEKELACGHRGIATCSSNPLEDIKCEAKVEKEWLKCKHVVKVPCYMNPAEHPCPSPCEHIFEECGHICEGTCSSCRGGTLHKPCSKPCNKIQICGHHCEGKCHEACLPCNAQVESVCCHRKKKPLVKERWINSGTNAAFKTCEEPRFECMKSCSNICDHRKCSQKCYQVCDVDVCMEPCGKALSCGKDHYCIGVCHGNRNCIPICRICNKMEFSQLFRYTENNSLFIQLEECGDVFEVTNFMTYLMTKMNPTPNEGISKLCCPKCHVPLCISRSINNYINQNARDIEKIKKLNTDLIDSKKQITTKIIERIRMGLRNLSFCDNIHFKKIPRIFYKSQMMMPWLNAKNNCITILEHLIPDGKMMESCQYSTISDSWKMFFLDSDAEGFLTSAKTLFNSIISRCLLLPTSDEIFQQLSNETERFGFMVDLYACLTRLSNPSNSQSGSDVLNKMMTVILSTHEFSGILKDQMEAEFEEFSTSNDIENCRLGREKIELIPISSFTKWYKREGEYRCE